MFFKREYFLDSDLQYKPIKLTKRKKLFRFLIFVILFFVIGSSYNFIYKEINDSPKEKILNENLEELKLKYSILNKRLDNSLEILNNFEISDNKRYRPILNLDTITKDILNQGQGGIKKYDELEGYNNSNLMISTQKQLEFIKSKSHLQYESFKILKYQTDEWIRELEHLPLISPVNIEIRRGDGIKFREKHPILGRPAWHHGQDFSAPFGTEVYATGAGKIKYVGKDRGLGNFITIQHGYGYESMYGHLSSFSVKKGDLVKRGDLIGLTGSTGYSTGPHLHYQINLYGRYQNPLHFFSDNLTEEEYIEMIDTLNSKFKKF